MFSIGGFIMAIGKRIRFFRNRKGMTQKQLGTTLKMKEPLTVSFLAQGEYNQNFLISDQQQRQAVFRVNYGTQINVSNQIKYEYEALCFLKNSGVTP